MADTTSYPVRFDKAKLRSILAGARSVHISGADVIRQAVDIGLPVVIARHSQSSARVTNIEPLAPGVLRRLYKKEDPAWAKIEAAATRHSAKPTLEE